MKVLAVCSESVGCEYFSKENQNNLLWRGQETGSLEGLKGQKCSRLGDEGRI